MTATNGSVPAAEHHLECMEKGCVAAAKEKTTDKAKFMTVRKAKILGAVVYGNLFLGSCNSLMAPFFPAEAELKGSSATQYGIIFGIYQLVMFIASPIHGKLVALVSPGYLLKAGMLTAGLCSISFGMLIFSPPGAPFVALSCCVSVVHAIGASAFLTASYTVLGCEFSDFIGRAMSIAETAFSVGLAIGPVFGGLLYELGGFQTPFYVIGALLLAGTVVNFILFKNMVSSSEKQEKVSSARSIMADIDFCLDILTIVTCFTSIGFNEATLEPHIRQFGLSHKTIGAIFLIAGLVDALTAFPWGFLAEKVENAQYFTMIGIIMYIACFLIIGPIPFLNFPTTLWVIIISQVLLGCAMGGEIVCSFAHGMTSAINRGFPENAGTYGIVSGILFSAACLGGFAGPAIGGFLVDTVGYKKSTLFIFVVNTVMALLLGSRLTWLAIRNKATPKPTPTTTEKPAKKCDENHN